MRVTKIKLRYRVQNPAEDALAQHRAAPHNDRLAVFTAAAYAKKQHRPILIRKDNEGYQFVPLQRATREDIGVPIVYATPSGGIYSAVLKK